MTTYYIVPGPFLYSRSEVAGRQSDIEIGASPVPPFCLCKQFTNIHFQGDQRTRMGWITLLQDEGWAISPIFIGCLRRGSVPILFFSLPGNNSFLIYRIRVLANRIVDGWDPYQALPLLGSPYHFYSIGGRPHPFSEKVGEEKRELLSSLPSSIHDSFDPSH